SASDEYIVIKLRSGYNVGISITSIKRMDKIDHPDVIVEQSRSEKILSTKLPRVALLSTGGTIASRIDYRTGGVHPALSASELYESVPELEDFAVIDPEVLLSEFSENISPAHWTQIARKAAEKIQEKKYSGIVITHGTDTMHYTASALSFALRNLPIP